MSQQIDMFHNTINLPVLDKAIREVKASKQNDQILKLFQDNPRTDFTAADVWLKFGQCWPITSCRRALTTLTDMGELEKTDRQRMGLYGTLNYIYQLKKKP